MALKQLQLTSRGEIKDKIEIAIDRLRNFEPEEGYYVAFSGGKDSQVIYHLCEMAGVKFDAHYSVTSVDPPELIYFIRKHYPAVSFDTPHKNGKQVSMWSLIIERKLPPTRIVRYCCEKLKECHGKGRITLTGVRWAESANRRNNQGLVGIGTTSERAKRHILENNDSAKLTPKGHLVLNDDNDESRRIVEQCYRTYKMIINPIVDWEDEDVWEYLNEVAQVEHCCLYDEGMDRIGCIGCPMAGQQKREAEFERWPKYKELYNKAFVRLFEENPGRYKKWNTAEEMWKWWMEM